MSKEKLVRDLGEYLDRRKFLVKAASAALAGLLGLLGIPQTALATYTWHCCNLCKPNSGSCSGCVCSWCWTCPQMGNNYACCECYSVDSSHGGCSGGCPFGGVKCSWAFWVSGSPAGGPQLPSRS